MDILQIFVEKYLQPFAGNPHLGLFLIVWFSAVFPLALPEEAFTLLGGAAVAAGILKSSPTGLAILGGIIATNITQYWMGRGGLKLIQNTRLGRRITDSQSFSRSRQAMIEKGIWAIVSCRFFFGARAPTYIATGFFRYNFWKFTLVDSSMVLLHGIPFLLIGYYYSDQIDAIISWVRQLGVWSVVLLVLIVGGYFAIKSLIRKRQASSS